MAKELFNSQRYKKKGFISDGKYWIIRVLAPLFAMPGILTCLALLPENDNLKYLYDNLFRFIFFTGLLSPLITTPLEIFNIFKYKEYTKILRDNKELFHDNGKTAYVAPYKTTLTNTSDLRISLNLRLLALVLKADKEELVKEMDFVKSYLKGLHKIDYEARLNEFKDYLKEDYSLEDVAFAMYWWFEDSDNDKKDDDLRFNTLKVMLDLAYADGDLCESEEFLIRYAAYHMHIIENEYELTLKKHFSEPKYEGYLKARYKRDGGYWVRNKNGRKQWHSFENENQKTDNNSNTSYISAELQKAYAVLGIPVDATPSEINACKRNLLRINHPDLVASRGQEAVNAATAKCQLINQAYELLKANGKC